MLADKIYMNQPNRRILKEYEIRAYCKPVGRPPKEHRSPEYLKKMVKAVGERNEVECSFGTGKRVYRANNIRAKLPETAECWTAMCYFVKNVMKFLRNFVLPLSKFGPIYGQMPLQSLESAALQLWQFINSENTNYEQELYKKNMVY